MIKKQILLISGFTSAFFIYFLFLSGAALADEDIKAEALYHQGLIHYRQGKYVSARLDFNEIIANHSGSTRVTSAYMLLAKTLFNLGEFETAESTALALRRSYPRSRYAEWTMYFSAACRLRLGDSEKALEILAQLAGRTKDATLKSHTLEALRNSLLSSTDPAVFYAVLEKNGVAQSDIATAESSPAVSEPVLYQVRSNIWTPSPTLKIGLLAPLTGVYFERGNQLLAGVRAALENHTEISGMPVELLVEDTESNAITAVLKARSLISQGVIALIGPVYGESTITTAIEAHNAGIPFLAPTAPDVGLPDIGRYVFQLNQNPVIQAESLADFAVNFLGFTNAAVITSRDEWGETVSKTFTEEMIRLGGRIIYVDDFEPGIQKSNYDNLLMKIRESAPESAVSQDSLLVIDHGNAFPDTIVVKHDPRLSPQMLKLVDTIDCILISAEPDDAHKIALLIRDYNIRTTILGDSGWSANMASGTWGEYVEGSYLVSTMTDLTDNLGSPFFTDDFRARINELETQTSRKGYDACAVLIHCLAQGARDPDALTAMLESVQDFKGLSSKITLDKTRHTNTTVEFVQIRNGNLVQLNPSTAGSKRN